MQACVTQFRIISGTGTQTITGIVDSEGAAFTPALLLFFSGSTENNVLYSNPSTLENTVASDIGLHIAATGEAAYAAIATYPFGPFSASKWVSGASGTRYAVCSIEADIYFGGQIYRIAEVTSVDSGEFTIDVSVNANYFDTDIMVVALGGDDLEVESPNNGGLNGNHAVSFQPKGLLSALMHHPASTGTVATGAGGGGGAGMGWDTPNGGPMATHLFWETVGSNFTHQRTDTFRTWINPTPAYAALGFPAVSAWGIDSYDVTGDVSSLSTPQTLVFGGDGIVCASVAFIQNETAGTQTIDVGIAPKFVLFASHGAPPSESVLSPVGELLFGCTNGVAQGSYWTAISSVSYPPDLDGASYISDTTLLRFGDPAGAATTFDAVAEISGFEGTTFTLNWLTSDGGGREILAFVIGEEYVAPPPPAGSERRLIRRERVSPHFIDDDKWQFFVSLTLDVETGQSDR